LASDGRPRAGRSHEFSCAEFGEQSERIAAYAGDAVFSETEEWRQKYPMERMAVYRRRAAKFERFIEQFEDMFRIL